ncbi:MAG TPA: ATP-binding protein [Longimicrobiaceae bacterium]|nr:ATP-binding protein [Longimicrobiaceae bacterium]
MNDTEPSAATQLFAGGGEMRAQCRAKDWAATPLGPVEGWPPALRVAAATTLACAFPAIVLWGPELVQVYNDGYVGFMGVKHPRGLGMPNRECWPEVWEFNQPIFHRALAGETVFLRDQLYRLRRRGPDAPPDEVHITLSYGPLVDEHGAVAGVLVTLIDTTEQVTGRAYQAALRRSEAEHLVTIEELRLARDTAESTAEELSQQVEEVQVMASELEEANEQLEESQAELQAQAAALDHANAALRASEARFRNVLEQAPVAVAVLEGPEHVYTLVSPRYAESPGNGRKLLGLPVRLAFPELHDQGLFDVIERVYRTGEPFSAPERRVWLDRNRDGMVEEYFYDVGYQPLRDAAGAVYAVASVAVEVTTQVRARQEVDAARRAAERAEQHLTRTFEQAPVAIAVLEGPEHVFTLANPPYLTLVGERPLQGLSIREAFPELKEQGIYELLDRVRATGEPYAATEQRLTFQWRAGQPPEERVLNFNYQPLRDAGGQVYAIAAVAIDVTDQVRGRDLAEAANRAKAEFLASMSHELRTPLNAIAGYADLLLMGLRGELGADARADVERMRRSGQHLLSLINDILNFAKIEAGQLRYELERVPVAVVLADLEVLVTPQVTQRGLTYVSAPGEGGLSVWADEEKMRQILLNLVTNAIKFTEPGGSIRVSYHRADNGVRVSVRDTGRGIAPEQQARIFDPFVQVDRHLTAESQQGVGLGLAISRDLARGMGGDLGVESTPGQGSTFTLWLPLVPVPDA